MINCLAFFGLYTLLLSKPKAYKTLTKAWALIHKTHENVVFSAYYPPPTALLLCVPPLPYTTS
jgi:hypothetical protein